ncbi:bifunctional (p)ppGpp synthetase/guanosine-3',5'-bis(diphosphate) 3'-pyrophosphohydrolase [bacterium]|nr:bifunctional (p)ppGpp synthetase/guanosine-3',5'-bis(diphosphate) 3'-pyrophosphohydrolase [bacterium]
MSPDAKNNSIEESIAALIEKTPDKPGARDLVRHAFEVAEKLHADQRRKSGEPYIEHPLAVAHMLCDINMDAAAIAAGLLHDVLEDTELTLENMHELFPEPVPTLVEGVTKISRMHFDTTRDHQIENLRKIILAMARDIRVIIIKLCDRLHNMRTLRSLPPDRRIAIARESLDIYAPLANRMGMVRIKTELEDLAMYWIYSNEYRQLSKMIAKKKIERETHLQKSMGFLRNYLSELGHDDVDIKGRSKHFYSIFRKMRNQGLTFEEIYDLNALRILCKTEAQCYEILGQIHSIWHPVPGRIKDYIGMPKPNMYQSLHTTVIGLEGMVTEIQIRTQDMHRVAEYGIAAHWKYKEGRIDQSIDKRLQWLRQLADWATEATDPSNFLDGLKKDVFADVVLCFTPRGDVIELPAGATPIDFAYAIHTQVGERCVGARVNRRMVSLRTTLTHGDVVEIQTSQTGHPSRDWLDVVVTGRARSKIKHWLKSKEMVRWVTDGRESLNRLLKERNIDVTKSELDKHLETLLEPFRLQTIDDLLAEIGFGSISPQAALTRMNPEWSKPRQSRSPRKRPKRKQGAITVDGIDDMPIKIANCCNPIPGDPIVGFITRGRGVTVHHRNCSNVSRFRNQEGESQRILPAVWNTEGPISHTVFLRVETFDRAGLLMDLTREISKHNIFIVACHTRSQKGKGTATLRFEVDVSDITQLEEVLASIRQVRNVIKAERTNRPV